MLSICLVYGLVVALGGFRPRSFPGEIPHARAGIRPEAGFFILNPPRVTFFGRDAAARGRPRVNQKSSCTPRRNPVNHGPGICWSRTKYREVRRPKAEQDSPGPVVSGAGPGAY